MGDLLVLITDGVFEYENALGQPYGVAAVQRHLAAHAQAPARALAEGLLADLRRFAGDAPQEDDLTMVIVKRLPMA